MNKGQPVATSPLPTRQALEKHREAWALHTPGFSLAWAPREQVWQCQRSGLGKVNFPAGPLSWRAAGASSSSKGSGRLTSLTSSSSQKLWGLNETRFGKIGPGSHEARGKKRKPGRWDGDSVNGLRTNTDHSYLPFPLPPHEARKCRALGCTGRSGQPVCCELGIYQKEISFRFLPSSKISWHNL